MSLRSAFLAAVLAGPVGAQAAEAQSADDRRPIDLVRDVGIEQRLGERLPLELRFTDEAGRERPLGDFFGQRPVVLALVYYECPMLCTQVLNGLIEAAGVMPLELGADFRVVTVSIDPLETPELARRKKASYVEAYGRGDADAWHALTGDEPAIEALAEAVGFRYRYDPDIDEYAHAAAIYVTTPDGRLARYFFGIEYAPRDLRLGLVEASDGEVGGLVEAFMMLCYHYDPLTGKYGFAVMSVIRLLGLATVGAIVAFLVISLRRDRRRARDGSSRRMVGVG